MPVSRHLVPDAFDLLARQQRRLSDLQAAVILARQCLNLDGKPKCPFQRGADRDHAVMVEQAGEAAFQRFHRMLRQLRRAEGSIGRAADGIAARQDISLSYLEQLFAKLRRGGLVTSVRGPGGGYRLSRPSGELRIADIILAVYEPIRAVRCKPGATLGCRGDRSRCLTHDLWEELSNQIHLYLNSVTLADVCDRRVLGTSGLAYRGNAAMPRRHL